MTKDQLCNCLDNECHAALPPGWKCRKEAASSNQSCKHFSGAQASPSQGTAGVGVPSCPWCEVERLQSELKVQKGVVDLAYIPHRHLVDQRDRADREFKNFHRLLCERFGYAHDEQDWRRDQLSLIEHISKRFSDETSEPLHPSLRNLSRDEQAKLIEHLWEASDGCERCAVRFRALRVGSPVEPMRELTLLDFGYAPGNYTFKCHDCGQEAVGDKRALRCERCATQALRENRTGAVKAGD